jgi:hypothetical protein
MSFDTTFDFSTLLSNITAKLTNFQSSLTTVEQCIIHWNSTVGYDAMKAAALLTLSKQQTALQQSVTGYQSTVTAIMNVIALSEINKAVLYAFWMLTTFNINNYMLVITNCFQAMLADADITAVLADNINPPLIKTNVAMQIMQIYSRSKFI